jgi:hypothetical protein
MSDASELEEAVRLLGVGGIAACIAECTEQALGVCAVRVNPGP